MATISKTYCCEIATEIWRQIRATTPMSVIFSWGVSKKAFTEVDNMAALVIKVSGFKFKGQVYIALNDVTDTYEIRAINCRGRVVKVIEDVYCDTLGRVLDNLIERDLSWSDDEYMRRVRNAYA